MPILAHNGNDPPEKRKYKMQKYIFLVCGEGGGRGGGGGGGGREWWAPGWLRTWYNLSVQLIIMFHRLICQILSSPVESYLEIRYSIFTIHLTCSFHKLLSGMIKV